MKELILVPWMTAVFSAPAFAQSVEHQPDGVIVGLPDGALNLQVCNERIIRVLFDPTGRMDDPRATREIQRSLKTFAKKIRVHR